MSETNVMNSQKVEASPVVHTTAAAQHTLLVSHDDMIHFYNGSDCSKLQNVNIQKVRELQDSNDKLQRLNAQLEKDVKASNDALTLLADKERNQTIIARNTGEILKIQIENERRLTRIAFLEAQNERLRGEIITQRDQFIDNHSMQDRTKHAADFFLTKSQIEKNINELLELTQE